MFEPELGQLVFSNTQWQEAAMQDEVEAIISKLGEQIADRDLVDGYDPSQNTGAVYETPVFKIRAYCWCDGEREEHKQGCPPNFEWRDFTACWYKWVGRGNSQSRELTAAELADMERECLASLPVGRPGGERRRRRQFAASERPCVECGHVRWMHLDTHCDGKAWEPDFNEVELVEGLKAVVAVLPKETTVATRCTCAGFKKR